MNQDDHCHLERLLSHEEVERVKLLLRQQSINIPESEIIARIQKVGGRRKCPFRFTIGAGSDFCADKCHLQEIFKPKP